MPDISKLVIEVDSKGVLKATGDLEVFSKIGQKAGKSADDVANKMGALQLIANKLPGPLKSVAAGLMGMVSPSTAVVSVITEVVSMMIQFSKESEEVYIKQEVSLARLGAVLNATGANTWTTTNSLKNMADSIRQETGRSTDEIMRMQSVLLGFTGITGENFERLTRNMVNMADVMGGDLASSANTFGRALENPAESLNALTRQGFVFTEEQKRMVRQLDEAGRIQEAQVIYLEAMERAFGDSAKATRDAAKSVNDYKQALEDLKLARGEFEASGGMTWSSFWREAMLPGIEDLAMRYREETQKRNDDKLYAELNKRADEVAKNYLQTIKTAEELVAIIESGKADINDLYRAVMGKAGDGKNWNESLRWNEAYVALTRYKDEYERLQEAKRKEAERLQGNKNNFNENITKIEIAYDDTSEGKAEKLRKEIVKWEDLRNKMWEVDTGVFEGLIDENKRKIDVIIRGLQEGLSGVKTELSSWQKIFKSAMKMSDEDIKQDWFKRQASSISEFTRILSTANERAKILSNTFGADLTKNLEQAAEQWERLASEMIMSGEWQSNSDLFLRVVEYARQAREAFGEASLDKLISDTNHELSLLRMTTYEMEKQKLIAEYKVANEEKINKILSDRMMLEKEQEKINIISRVTGLKDSEIQGESFDSLFYKISTRFTVKDFEAKMDAMMGRSDYADETKALLSEWEDIFKTLNSFDFRGLLNEHDDEELGNFLGNIAQKITEAKETHGEAYIAKLVNQLEDAGKSTYELAVKRLMLEQNITKETAEQALSVQKQIDYITKGYDLMGDIMTQIDDALKSIRESLSKGEKVTAEQYRNYAEGELEKSAMEAIEGTDVGTFVKTLYETGSAEIAAIQTLIESLVKVIMSIEGIDQILNPFTATLMEFKDIFKSILLPALVVSKALVLLGERINWLLNFITFGYINQMARMYDSLLETNDERQKEGERLRALNEQYAKLYSALKEQEEYYLQQRRHLNAEWAIENYQAKNVNDMILSPHGVFRTDPEDYIIATKHPENLANSGGSVPVYVTVINNANSTVSTQESTSADGSKEIMITVEGIVQNGLANGKFDSALDAAALRRSGKRTF